MPTIDSKRFLSLIAGSVLLLGGAVVPVYSAGDMDFLYAYTEECASAIRAPELTETSATGTTVKSARDVFKPAPCDGYFAAAVFRDSVGMLHTIEISKERYAAMGRNGGASMNPSNSEYRSLLDMATPRAEAAIAYSSNATSGGFTSGTSVTFSIFITSTTTDVVLLTSPMVDDGDTLTTVTHNGDAMTEIAKLDTPGVGAGIWAYFYYRLNPDTGTNNIVISRDGSGVVRAEAVSYTGVTSSCFPEDSATNSGVESEFTSYVMATSTTDNAWMVAFVQNDQRAFVSGDHTAATNVGGSAIIDSNADITPAGEHTLTKDWDVTAADWTAIGIMLTPESPGCVVEAAASIESDFVIFD